MCKGDGPGKQERNRSGIRAKYEQNKSGKERNTSGICAENRAGNGRDYERNTSVKVAEYALKIGRETDWITRGNGRRIGEELGKDARPRRSLPDALLRSGLGIIKDLPGRSLNRAECGHNTAK